MHSKTINIRPKEIRCKNILSINLWLMNLSYKPPKSAFCIVVFGHHWEEIMILSWNSILFLENLILWTVESGRNIENHGPRKILALVFGLCDEVRSLFSSFNIYSDSIGSVLYKFRILDLNSSLGGQVILLVSNY